jgi:hypothetical protein
MVISSTPFVHLDVVLAESGKARAHDELAVALAHFDVGRPQR